MAERRWQIQDTHVCDEPCAHLACRAFRAAEGRCLLCTRKLEDDLFAYRSNGTGASHVSCRMEKLGRGPVLPRLVTDGGEFQVAMPRDDEEADSLRAVADAAERLLTSALIALRAYDGTSVLQLREERR
jgi:hypothetical protein